VVALGRTRGLLYVLAVAVAGLPVEAAESATLVARAVLPADTFAPGPTSGQFILPANGREPPFVDLQPIQGFSGILPDSDGTFMVITDNGYGSKTNSPDFVLRVYGITPDFRTANGGSGTMNAKLLFSLRDPDGRIEFPIVADMEFYPSKRGSVLVDPAIREQRLLTGADFDPESFRKVPDGTFYFGDEFGPFLLHTDDTGRVLEAPRPLPGVASPENPLAREEDPPNLRSSQGFEGMALSPEGTVLLPMLEGSLPGQDGQLNIYEFDLSRGAYTHSDPRHPPHKYRRNPDATAIGDFTLFSGTRGIVIERDDGQGPEARFKKLFLVDLARTDEQGFLIKEELADLLDIADPDDVSGFGTGRFDFPFWTTEGVIVVDDRTVGVLNDNNYPFTVGRHAEITKEPDDTEFILLRFDQPVFGPR
jgi:hypothetical protein